MPRNPAARSTSTPPASANLTSKVVRPGQADSKRQARGHAAKAQANADAVAKLNADRAAANQAVAGLTGADPVLPAEMSRPQLVTYLQAAGQYAGHSRDSVDQLRDLAREVRYAGQATEPEPVACTLAPTARPASDGRLATTCGSVVNPAGYCCQCGAQLAEPGGTEPLAVADNPVVRYRLAKAEHAHLQQWIKDGSRPPKPATPNLDVVEAEHAAAGGKPKGKAERTGTPRAAANRDATYAKALEAKRAGADKRGRGTKVTDAELAEVIAKAKADRPANTAAQELEVAYWLGGLAVSRSRWMAAWAGAEAQQAVA